MRTGWTVALLMGVGVIGSVNGGCAQPFVDVESACASYVQAQRSCSELWLNENGYGIDPYAEQEFLQVWDGWCAPVNEWADERRAMGPEGWDALTAARDQFECLTSVLSTTDCRRQDSLKTVGSRSLEECGESQF